MKRILAFLLALCLATSLLSFFAFAEKDAIYDIALDSQGVYVYNLESKTAVYEKAQDVRMAPASTTKIMTALVVLELCEDPKGTIVNCPSTSMFDYIVRDRGVHINLTKGEDLSVYDLLVALLIESACDVADLLAWHFGNGEIEVFIEKMNEKAAAMGLENTHFTNAHGLTHRDHYSSPRDIAAFLEEAMKNPTFREIVSMREYTIPATSRQKARKLEHTVDIYDPENDYYLDCFVGGKSGYTAAAGRCLATYSEKDGMTYVSVLLGANTDKERHYPGNMSWIETHTLVSYAYEHYEIRTVLEKGTEVTQIGVVDSDTTIPVVAGEEIRILARKDSNPTYELDLPEAIPVQQVAKEAQVGKAVLTFNGEPTEAFYPLLLNWDGQPVPVKSALEKSAESTWSSISGIFKSDPIFSILLIVLLLTVGICLPAMKITQNLHRKNFHKPKH